LLFAAAACGDSTTNTPIDGSTPIDGATAIDGSIPIDAPTSTGCVGDDSNEPNNTNGTATAIAAPTSTPTTATGAICSAAGELDVYSFTLSADGAIRFTLDFTGSGNDIDLNVSDSSGNTVTSGLAVGPEDVAASLTAGTYYIELSLYEPMNSTTSVAYTLSLTAAECLSPFDCGSSSPVCADYACVAAPGLCTGDDANEPDDGPSVATPLTMPTAPTMAFGTFGPTVVSGAICNSGAGEFDWYSFNVTSPTGMIGSLSFASGNDMDLYFMDSSGNVVASGTSTNPTDESAFGQFDIGTYYAIVVLYSPADTVAAVPYTLTLSLPECQDSFDCVNPAEPVCSGGMCIAGPADCTGDDGAEPGDDGPAGARNLTDVVGTPVALSGMACGGGEPDWYRVDTSDDGEGLTLNLSFTNGEDFDATVVNDQGDLLALSYWQNPEMLTLTYLPQGTYYVIVTKYQASPTVTATAYTITATRTAAQTCTSAADCAAVYSTQLYRGSCNGTTGACEFIPDGAGVAGAACDSPGDCTSAICSYSLFESDAQDSSCSLTCTTTSECITALGSLWACTAGFSSNICMPTCANNIECGANPGSDTLDASQPWDYWVCTSGSCGP
jgi:hypothetical protein